MFCIYDVGSHLLDGECNLNLGKDRADPGILNGFLRDEEKEQNKRMQTEKSVFHLWKVRFPLKNISNDQPGPQFVLTTKLVLVCYWTVAQTTVPSQRV